MGRHNMQKCESAVLQTIETDRVLSPVPVAGSATYQIWFRLPVSYPNLTLTLKVTITYAVQSDTEIKFNIVLCIKFIFPGQGVCIQMAYIGKAQIILDDD